MQKTSAATRTAFRFAALRGLGLAALFLALCAGAALAENNDFYDDLPLKDFSGPMTIEVAGEVANPGAVDLARLPLRSVMVREAVPEGAGSRFVGAYRYDGPSLFDIIKNFELKKKSKDLGSPIDLLICIENAKGEKAVVSWGEVFYPVDLHRILIATRGVNIVPSKTKEIWPLATETRLVCADDLLTVRGIAQPTRITIFSADWPAGSPKEKPAKMYSPKVTLFDGTRQGLMKPPAPGAEKRTFPTVFYGRGKGFHGTENFRGTLFLDALKPFCRPDARLLQQGWLTVGAPDGYRVAISASELFNRADCREFLLIDLGRKDDGRFTLFPASDYFSDRAVKAFHEIHLCRLP